MEIPDEFPFPFPPYSIQKDFMVNLYSCLDKGNLGIFESPTGTGKSLSIICGALKWLMDYEKNNRDTLVKQLSDLNDKLKEISEESKGDWFSEQTKQMKVNTERQIVQDKLDALARRDERMNKFKETVKQDNFTKKRQWKVNSKSKNKNNCKDDDKEPDVAAKDTDDVDTDLLLDDLNLNSDSDDEETPVESLKYTQFFFCSRTHSQLTQFIGEIKKSPYSNAVSLVPLASR